MKWRVIIMLPESLLSKDEEAELPSDALDQAMMNIHSDLVDHIVSIFMVPLLPRK